MGHVCHVSDTSYDITDGQDANHHFNILTLEREPKREITYNFTISSALLLIFYKYNYLVYLFSMSSYVVDIQGRIKNTP